MPATKKKPVARNTVIANSIDNAVNNLEVALEKANKPDEAIEAFKKAVEVKYDKVWFLVPGYGSQGASAADCVRFCKPDGTGALISVSRSIIYAYEKPKYKEQFGDDWKRCVEQAVVDAKVDLAKGMQTLI